MTTTTNERFERLRDHLYEMNPEALLADGFEDALVGTAYRCGQPTLAAYSVKRCIEILIKRDGMSYEEADEYFSFNVSGAWMGEGTPVWLEDREEEEEVTEEEPAKN
jgi:hypothetical protein